MNILDVAENSVYAGATFIKIIVDENPAEDFLSVTIADNGCGLSEEQIKLVTDPFYTTRTTRKVGLGIPFFKQAAELTGGSFEIRSTVGKGTIVFARFVRSSIDRMPLGSINETVCTLVQCNPKIDFLYTRRLGNREISFDTHEFRRILDGIELSDPRVSQFIRDFLTENTDDLLQDYEA